MFPVYLVDKSFPLYVVLYSCFLSNAKALPLYVALELMFLMYEVPKLPYLSLLYFCFFC